MVVREMHGNISSSDGGISPMQLEVRLGVEEMYVTVRHVVGNGRDVDRLTFGRRKLPHNCANTQHVVVVSYILDGNAIQW